MNEPPVDRFASLGRLVRALALWFAASARVLDAWIRGRGSSFSALVRGIFARGDGAARGLRLGAVGAGLGMGAFALAGLMLLGLLVADCGGMDCPDVRNLGAYQPGGASVLLDRDGERFADLAPYEREIVPLADLPEYVPAAFIAVEDRRFWKHRGVDWVRVFGAAVTNLRARAVSEGSSTIPMQLARNVFPDELPGSQRTIRRKLNEVRVARRIEGYFEKSEILELYLNHIYFGGGAYGIEAASRLYFGKSAAELTLPEAATLAALPKAPSHYDPRRQPERSLIRRNLVLALMEQQGVIEAAEAGEARESPFSVRNEDDPDGPGAPFAAAFVDAIRAELEEDLGEALYRSRLRIHTTLDVRAQRIAERELQEQLASLDGQVRAGDGPLQGAVVILEPGTGEILAMVGGRDARMSRYNRAALGRRQLGSAFKPFVFAQALEVGIPTSSVLSDAPLRMEISHANVWEPTNYDGRFEGATTLREALVRSRNLPVVRLATTVGISRIAAGARAAGFTAPMDETPALALGTVAVSPLMVAGAYGTLASMGRRSEPRTVRWVEGEDGRPVWESPAGPSEQVMDPRVVYIVTHMLRDAVTYGTGVGVRSTGYQGPAAGKTGTTNDAADAWFAGYTPDLVGVVWVGYDRPSSLGPAATGGGLAAPIWGRIMRDLYEERPAPTEWAAPEGLVRHTVDLQTGFVLEEGCQASGGVTSSEIFLVESVPPTSCPRRGFLSALRNIFRGDRSPESRSSEQTLPAVPIPREE